MLLTVHTTLKEVLFMYWLLIIVTLVFNIAALIAQLATATSNRYQDKWVDLKSYFGIGGLIIAIVTAIWHLFSPHNYLAILSIAANIIATIAWGWMWYTDHKMCRQAKH